MTAENTQGQHLLPASAFVDLLDASGEVVGSVPKHWTADDLPAGTKKKAGKASKDSGTKDSGTNGAPKVPAKSSSRTDLNAYAVEHGGMTAEEAEAFKSGDELHAELTDRAKGSDDKS